MTYGDLTNIILKEVRPAQVWPTLSDTDRAAEIARYIFGAAIVFVKELPLHLYRDFFKSVNLTQAYYLSHPVFNLPEDFMYIRPDAGILSVMVDMKERQTPSDFISHPAFREAVKNPYQDKNILIHIDTRAAELYLIGGYSASMEYLPMFELPESDISSTALPVPDSHTDAVRELVGMHIEAILTGDRQKSAVHKALSDVYGGMNKAPAAS
jgi:hypothetical protein